MQFALQGIGEVDPPLHPVVMKPFQIIPVIDAIQAEMPQQCAIDPRRAEPRQPGACLLDEPSGTGHGRQAPIKDGDQGEHEEATQRKGVGQLTNHGSGPRIKAGNGDMRTRYVFWESCPHCK